MIMKKVNYHTHSFYCQHAYGTIEQIVEEAIKLKIDILGFSEHSIFINNSISRMNLESYHNYLNDIKYCKEKYKDQIVIKSGLEIDYFPMFKKFYKKLRNDVDYLALSVHYFDYDEFNMKNYKVNKIKSRADLIKYQDYMIDGIRSGLFSFICHPDIFLKSITDFNDDVKMVSINIIKEANEFNLPLELNANGMRRGKFYNEDNELRYYYPRLEFFKLVKELNGRVIINSDSHSISYLYDKKVEEAYKMAKDLKLDIVYELDS